MVASVGLAVTRVLIERRSAHADVGSAGFKGSSTHLQVATNLRKSSSLDSLRLKKNTCKVLDPSTFTFRIEKQKCSPNFLLFSMFSKGVVPTL